MNLCENIGYKEILTKLFLNDVKDIKKDKVLLERLHKKIDEILKNPEHAKQVAANARALAERYDWRIIARDMKSRVFDRVLKEG